MSASRPPGGSDPSMDDILASIRKILNEDEQGGATIAPPPAPPSSLPAPIQLTAEMMISPPEGLSGPAAAVFPTPVVQAAPPSQPEPFLMSLDPQGPPPGGLVDAVAAAATASAFGQLSRLAQERTASVTRSGPSIEDVVREELRPMLKAWLDAHLPATVERLIQAEIQRVMSRQG